ncbi:energy transducer TonB [Polaromonas sp.]|uniref:energy transducer TonB n=1 Tax=Polaromonas sp. TaxID=1869339 RepID=UPI00286B5933|nr:energy transducer TonB [Polaromonas sp.]
MNATTLRSPLPAPAPRPHLPLGRNTLIALAVVALHVGLIWALQMGLLMRTAELLVPAEILVQFVDPPAPKMEPAPSPAPAPTRAPAAAPAVQKKAASKAPAQVQPQPLAIVDPTPSPNALAGVIAPPVDAAPAPGATAAAAAPGAAAGSGGPDGLQLPSSDAAYLQNPRPPYPAISKRLGEQGKVVVRVLIGIDGTAQKVEIRQSSGFERLDQAALSTVQRWRYVPGKRGGVPEAMWFNVPVNFVLD